MHLVRNRRKRNKRNRTSVTLTDNRLKSFGRAGKKMTPVFASALIFMEEIEPNLGSRVKFGGFLKLGICRRVSYPFLLFDMCTRRRRIPTLLKQIHGIPSTKHPRLPVFAKLYGGFGPRMR